MMRSMCPSCGQLFETATSIIPDHVHVSADGCDRITCMGSGQHARNPDSDRRPLWNGLPNPHMASGPGPQFPVTTTTTSAPVPQLCHFPGFDAGPDALAKLADECGTRVVVNTRQHNDDLIGRILANPTGHCSDCGSLLELAHGGVMPFHWVCGPAPNYDWIACAGHGKPPAEPDTPHVVGG